MHTTQPATRYAFLEQPGQSTASSQHFAFNSMQQPIQNHQQLMQDTQSGAEYFTSIHSQSGVPVKNRTVGKHTGLSPNIKNELTDNIEIGQRQEVI